MLAMAQLAKQDGQRSTPRSLSFDISRLAAERVNYNPTTLLGAPVSNPGVCCSRAMCAGTCSADCSDQTKFACPMHILMRTLMRAP